MTHKSTCHDMFLRWGGREAWKISEPDTVEGSRNTRNNVIGPMWGKCEAQASWASLVTEHPVWTWEAKERGSDPETPQKLEWARVPLVSDRDIVGINGASGRSKVPCSGICRCQCCLQWQRSDLWQAGMLWLQMGGMAQALWCPGSGIFPVSHGLQNKVKEH